MHADIPLKKWSLLPVLLGLTCCGGAGVPASPPITVTATAPESSAAPPAAGPDLTAPGPDAGAPGEPPAPPPPPPPPEGQVRAGPVTVTGKLGPEEIQGKMAGHMPTFTACQKAALAEGAPASGTLRLRILIDQTGQVSSANVTAPSTLKNDKLARCVLKAVRATAFPRPSQGTVEATYSVVFSQQP